MIDKLTELIDSINDTETKLNSNITLKTDFINQLHKDCYYDNVLSILYGIDNKHKITFKDNNRYNVSSYNIKITDKL
tara:strand:- start:179 stop:409 length:231 start_codon:yes stop_codon:yes gene_type:complete